jgi:hypothetical protein
MNASNSTPKFSPGQVAATPDALEAIAASGQTFEFFLDRHLQADWGEVNEEDWTFNGQAVVDGSRILSVYSTLKGVKLWIITEAEDEEGRRAATTILLPDNY